jgi:hypothetical protein
MVRLLVESDPGVPLQGAQVFAQGKAQGATNAKGAAALTLNGPEGTTFDFTIQCPEGFRSPTAPVAIVLHRLGDSGIVPEYKATCMPLTRSAVVAVIAERGPNLPVIYLGREVGRTDGSGAANVLLQVTPGEQFTLALSTEGDKASKALKPQNPTMTFAANDRDEVFVFREEFTPPKVVFHGPHVDTGPVAIHTHNLH